jgi:quercetin dioxygenase-like cupin family protein
MKTIHKFAKIFTIITSVLLPFVATPNEADTTKKLSFEILQKTRTSWDGTALPNYPLDLPEVTIVRVIVPPNSRIKPHKHALINVAYVVKGSISVTSATGQNETLHAGDTIVELVNTWHHAEVLSSMEVELIVFYLGPSSLPLAIYQE